MFRRAFALALATSLLTVGIGCEELVTPADSGLTEETTSSAGPAPTSPGTWAVHAHPCLGNRTDTMLWEGDTVWVGCGSTTEGTGLYRSTDGGASWAAPATSPAGFLDAFRVSSVSRSADGLLYVAGINTLGSERVIRLDTASEPYPVSEVFSSTGELWSSFHVGTFRRASSGLAVAESLTGTGLVYRTADDQPWQDGYGWWTSGTSYQILDMDLHQDRFYGVGSTISQPPFVFLPSSAGGGFALDPVQLAVGTAAYSGEMWSIDVASDGIIVGGADQERDVGMVYVGPPDPQSADDFAAIDVSEHFPGEFTWTRGVCRRDGVLVAVGEFSSRGDGWVLVDAESGSFAVVTPGGDVPALHRCTVLEDGRVAVAGAAGWLGVYAP